MTKVVNRKTDSFDIYIGRGSKWGNPFVMKSESERNKVCDDFETYFWTSGLFHDISELVDKTLGCYCKPKRCHGDFLAECANFYQAHGYINRSDFETSRKEASQPVSEEPIYILHQTNCQNAFGSGFAGYLNKVFPKAKQTYHEAWKRYYQAFGSKHAILGNVAYAEGDGFTIVHCFGQEYYGNSRKTNKVYTNYRAVEEALETFRAHHPNAKAICPVNMGCGLAGGDWNRYSAILAKYNIEPVDKIDIATNKVIDSSEPTTSYTSNNSTIDQDDIAW